jgi:hypothetical protein
MNNSNIYKSHVVNLYIFGILLSLCVHLIYDDSNATTICWWTFYYDKFSQDYKTDLIIENA